MDNIIIELIKKKIIVINSDSTFYFNFNNLISYQYLITDILNIIEKNIKNINHKYILGYSPIGVYFSSLLSYRIRFVLLFNMNKTRARLPDIQALLISLLLL